VRQDQFVREMGAIRTRIGAFRKRAAAQPPGIELLPEALEELSGALEELRVSEEQMRVQADELASERVRLDEERRRFQELFELAPASYLVTDRAGMVREANRHACRALRTEWRFLDGRPLSAFVPLDDRFAFRGLLRQLDDGEPHSDVRLRLQPHGGAPLLATLAVSTVRDAGGQITRICWLARELAPAGQPAAAEAYACSVLASQLQYALDQRVVIEQAKGILMERSGLSSQAAFERLRSTARSRHRKLADVAAEVVSGRR
jgi:PAS domain S-box-containing protein